MKTVVVLRKFQMRKRVHKLNCIIHTSRVEVFHFNLLNVRYGKKVIANLILRNYGSFHGLFLRQYMYNVIRRATSTHLAIYYAIVTKVNVTNILRHKVKCGHE